MLVHQRVSQVSKWDEADATNVYASKSVKPGNINSYGPSYTSYKYQQVTPFIDCIIPLK